MNKEITAIGRILTALGMVGGGAAGNLDCATKPVAQVELTQIPTSTEALAKATQTIEWPTANPDPTKTATLEPTSTSTPEPTKTPTPEVSLLEQAIKAGRIELKEGNWEDYFIGVTSDEAKQLLEDANQGVTDNDNLKDLLAFDPRQTPNLILSDVEFDMPGGKSRVIGMKNIPVGTMFYTVVDNGTAEFKNSVTAGSTLAISYSVEKNGVNYNLAAPRKDAVATLPPRVKTPNVKIGTKAFTIGSEEALGIYPGEQQVIYESWWAGRQIYDNTLSKLLIKGGKIVFIDWQN